MSSREKITNDIDVDPKSVPQKENTEHRVKGRRHINKSYKG